MKYKGWDIHCTCSGGKYSAYGSTWLPARSKYNPTNKRVNWFTPYTVRSTRAATINEAKRAIRLQVRNWEATCS